MLKKNTTLTYNAFILSTVRSCFIPNYVRLLLGTFELHVTTGNTLTNSSTLCRAFNFSGIKQYQTALECVNAIDQRRHNYGQEDRRRLTTAV